MVRPFVEGDLVKVLERQSPGVNKAGGVGRVSRINEDGTVAVSYVLGKDKDSSVDVKVSFTTRTAAAVAAAVAATAAAAAAAVVASSAAACFRTVLR